VERNDGTVVFDAQNALATDPSPNLCCTCKQQTPELVPVDPGNVSKGCVGVVTTTTPDPWQGNTETASILLAVQYPADAPALGDLATDLATEVVNPQRENIKIFGRAIADGVTTTVTDTLSIDGSQMDVSCIYRAADTTNRYDLLTCGSKTCPITTRARRLTSGSQGVQVSFRVMSNAIPGGDITSAVNDLAGQSFAISYKGVTQTVALTPAPTPEPTPPLPTPPPSPSTAGAPTPNPTPTKGTTGGTNGGGTGGTTGGGVAGGAVAGGVIGGIVVLGGGVAIGMQMGGRREEAEGDGGGNNVEAPPQEQQPEEQWPQE
jgi:hypothetical protein